MSVRPTYANVFGCSTRFWKSLKLKYKSIPFPFLRENNMYMSIITLVILEPGPIISPLVHLFFHFSTLNSHQVSMHTPIWCPITLHYFDNFTFSQTIISYWEDAFTIPHHKILFLLSLSSQNFSQKESCIHFLICICLLICVEIQLYCHMFLSCSLFWFIC